VTRSTLRPLAALAVAALLGAGCSSGSAEDGDAGGSSTGTKTIPTAREKAVRFAECMRDNGVDEFPDPDASGGLTIDAVVNGSSLDTSAPPWTTAIAACKDLQPPGFTGPGRRSTGQQEAALEFAQCIRENGVEDFPDPMDGEPLVDTNRIPSSASEGGMAALNAAMQTCGDLVQDMVGRP
jgi:hypothetical protein